MSKSKREEIPTVTFFHTGKEGVSPVIATVLLIGIVVALAGIIFLWFRSFAQEAVVKGGQNVELTCQDVQFSAELSDGGDWTISNNGNIPIYLFRAEIVEDRNTNTQNIEFKNSAGENIGINPGGVERVNLGPADSITLIPVILGENEDGTPIKHTCENVGQKVL